MLCGMNALDLVIHHFGSQIALATALGVRSPSISEWRRRGRVPVDRCRDIVRATQGAVTLTDLRPDIWPGDEQPKAGKVTEGGDEDVAHLFRGGVV